MRIRKNMTKNKAKDQNKKEMEQTIRIRIRIQQMDNNDSDIKDNNDCLQMCNLFLSSRILKQMTFLNL